MKEVIMTSFLGLDIDSETKSKIKKGIVSLVIMVLFQVSFAVAIALLVVTAVVYGKRDQKELAFFIKVLLFEIIALEALVLFAGVMHWFCMTPAQNLLISL